MSPRTQRVLHHLLTAGLLLGAASEAQTGNEPFRPERLTPEDYARAQAYSDRGASTRVKNMNVAAHWIGDTDRFWYVRELSEGWQFMLVDADRRKSEPAFDHDRLAGVLVREGDDHDLSASRLPLQDLELTESLESMHFSAFGKRWTCALDDYSCDAVPESKATAGAVLSPDGRVEVFRRERNLWLRELDSGNEKQLTRRGEQFHECGWVNGEFQVYVQMELGASVVPPMVVFSPDGTKLLTHCYDERAVRGNSLWQGAPPDGSRPKSFEFKLSRAGDEHIPLQTLKVIDVASGDSRTLEKAPGFEVLYGALSEDIWWTDDSKGIYFLAADRYQKTVRLSRYDVSTGTSRVLMEETGTTQVNLRNGTVAFPGHNVHVLSNGDFTWFSERSGWGHLYLHDGETGRQKAQLTCGEWVVYDVVSIDEDRGVVYVVGAGRENGRSPYYQRLYRVALDGSEPELLTAEDKDHRVPEGGPMDQGSSQPMAALAPSGSYFVTRMATADTLAQTVLRDDAGALLMTLETADPGELQPESWIAPVPFSARAADGKTDIYGTMVLPSHFDSAKKYPVIDYTYSAPFYISLDIEAAFDRGHLWCQGIAELGFVVVRVHGRGTPGRSKAFQDFSYDNLQSGPGMADHVAAIQQLGERFSYLDLDRVGVTGFSSGGYNTVLAMLEFPDFFKVGVAGAPGIDYTDLVRQVSERYHGPGGDDGPSYQEMVLADKASQLEGKLLIGFSDLDENAPPGPMVKFIAALTAANRNYDLVLMPNHRHGFAVDPYWVRRSMDYLVEHLMGSEPPAP